MFINLKIWGLALKCARVMRCLDLPHGTIIHKGKAAIFTKILMNMNISMVIVVACA